MGEFIIGVFVLTGGLFWLGVLAWAVVAAAEKLGITK